MTRISEYKLLACPYCNQIHRKAMHSSVNLSVSPDFLKREMAEKTCANCKRPIQISEMFLLGIKEVKPIIPDYLRPENIDTRTLIQKIRDLMTGKKFVIKEFPKEDQEWINYPVI